MTDLFEVQQTNDDTSLRDELTAKWKDKPAEELLKAKVEADLYIKTLEKQKDELRADYLTQREELLAKAKFEDLLTQFKSSPETPAATPPAKEVESPKEPVDIDAKVRKLIEETRQADRRTANVTQVQEKLRERFGNNYQSVLKDTGLSNNQINDIAGDSPEAIFRLVGLRDTQREDFQTPPRSAQRSDNFSPKGQTKRDWNYYQELKKTNPKLYLDPKLSVQMHNDAIEQGEAFYG